MEFEMVECPKCHKKHLRAVIITDPKDLDHKSWAIRCDMCQHTGKGADTPEEALKNWNAGPGYSNYQYIKWHADKEDMAKFLEDYGSCNMCAYKPNCATMGSCIEGIKKWLDMKYEGGTSK